MTDMKTIEGMQLVLRISGAVEESNLVKFETDALEALANIKRNLETDNDFLEAEQNIKTCKLIADRIATARNTALNQTKAISEVISITTRVEAKFNEVRLSLEKLVKSEKDRRKDEVMAAARDRLSDRLISSPVKHGFVIDRNAIANAAKNKRSLKNLEDAVNEVIDAELLRLVDLEVNFAENIAKIEEADAQWPGLFADRQNIALSAPETVEAVVAGRIADHRLRVAEKARKEQEEAERKAKAEVERIEAARLADNKVAELKDGADAIVEHIMNTFTPEPPANPSTDLPIPPPTNSFARFTLTINAYTDDISNLLNEIRAINGVKSVKIELS